MTSIRPEQRIQRLDRLAWLLDNSIGIPGTRFRIGVDSLIGLIPGFGDLAGIVLSAYILLQSARSGAPASVLWRMAGNILLEGVVGVIPLVGDLFDMSFKANARNVALLKAYHREPLAIQRRSRGLFMLAGLLVLALLAVWAVLILVLLRWLWMFTAG
ncbi:MAG: DUF4112 domain-containing protein [Parahaliea sp.]